jgi:transcriptional regulator with XRE-family HTH domain
MCVMSITLPDSIDRLDAQAAAVLRAARLTSGLTLRQLAARAGTSHSTLAAYERGRKVPGVTTFLRILAACGQGIDLCADRRIREADGLDRGEELRQALELAAAFPAPERSQSQVPRWPRWPQTRRRAA